MNKQGEKMIEYITGLAIIIMITMTIAKSKNKSLGTAFFSSLFLGIFALIYYIFCKREEEFDKEVTCSECGADVTKADKYCPECGEKFKQEFLVCQKCKAHNKLHSKFCSKCGYTLKDDKKVKDKKVKLSRAEEKKLLCG